MYPWEQELAKMESVSFSTMVGHVVVKQEWLHAYDTVKLTMKDGTVFAIRANRSTGEVDCYKAR